MASESLFMILLLREIFNQARPMVIRSTAARMSDFRYRRALPILTKGMRPFMRQSKSCRGLIRRKSAVSWSVMSLSSHCKPEGCSFMPKSACQPCRITPLKIYGSTPVCLATFLVSFFRPASPGNSALASSGRLLQSGW